MAVLTVPCCFCHLCDLCSYLHGKDHIHGDLRSPNLFVGADGKVIFE